MKHWLAIAFALTSAAASAQTLSLDEAIALGVAHNRTVANAELQANKSELDEATARSRRMPTFKIDAQASQLLQPVDLTFARGAFGTLPGVGPVPATDATVTTPARLSAVVNAQASQPLTPLIKLNLNVHISEMSTAYAREQARDSRLAVVGEIKRAYYAIAQTQSALDANQQRLALLREVGRVVALRTAQQVALAADRLSVDARVAETELTRLKLEHAVASQKEQLNQLLGRDVREPFDVVDVPDAQLVEIDLATAQARALDARPDVREARIKLQQTELARKVAKADFVPDVAFTVSYLSPLNIDGAPRQIATAAIQAQWEPFDWGRRGRTVAAKDLEIRQARNAVHDSESQALLDINNRFRRLAEARAELRTVRANQDVARENARMRAAQYEIKAALLSDVLQTQSTAADADAQYQQALAAFWTARAEFERALGEEAGQ